MKQKTIIIIYSVITVFALLSHPLHAQDKANTAYKLMDDVENDPKSSTSITKIRTAIAYFTDVLREKDISCRIERESTEFEGNNVLVPFIVINPVGKHYMNRLARSMNELGIDIIFHPYSLIDNEAVAMFQTGYEEKIRSRMLLSREFIQEYGLGKDKMSIKHELRHLLSYALVIMGYDNPYAAGITFEDDRDDHGSYKEGFVLDEIPAWAEDLYEYSRRLNKEFKRFYLGFHPELGAIFKELKLYFDDHIADGDVDSRKVKQDIMEFVYSYADGISDNSNRYKRLNSLLNSFYYGADTEKKEKMRKMILSLANRDLILETDQIFELGNATYYDDTALKKRLKELDIAMRAIVIASKMLDKFTVTTIQTLNKISARKNTMSFQTTAKEDYELTIRFTSGMDVSYGQWENKTTKNFTHIFEIDLDHDTNSYKVKIASKEKNPNLIEILFNRIEEQIGLVEKFNQKNIPILNKSKEYKKTVSSIIKQEQQDILDVKDLALRLRKDITNILEATKSLSELNRSSLSKDVSTGELVVLWKEYINGSDTFIKAEEKKETPTTSSNDIQFCEFEFDDTKQGILSPYDEKIVDDLMLRLAKNDLNIEEKDLDLLFGEADKLGTRNGGLFEYWSKDPYDGDNWIYIAIFGALVNDLISNDRQLVLKVSRAYDNAGFLDTKSSLVNVDRLIAAKPNMNIVVVKRLELIRNMGTKSVPVKY